MPRHLHLLHHVELLAFDRRCRDSMQLPTPAFRPARKLADDAKLGSLGTRADSEPLCAIVKKLTATSARL